MSAELKIREALARVKHDAWAITSSDRHWRREVRDPEGRGIAWCGLAVDAEAHAIADYVAAAHPAAMAELIAELDRLRATPAPGAPAGFKLVPIEPTEALADILKDLDHICAHGDAGSQETAHDARDKLRQFVTNSTQS